MLCVMRRNRNVRVRVRVCAGDMCYRVYVKEEEYSRSPLRPFTLSPNVIREAFVYLTFIIDNYHRLPRKTVFIQVRCATSLPPTLLDLMGWRNRTHCIGARSHAAGPPVVVALPRHRTRHPGAELELVSGRPRACGQRARTPRPLMSRVHAQAIRKHQLQLSAVAAG